MTAVDFVFTQVDLLIISLSVNTCVLIQILFSKIIEVFFPWICDRSSIVRSLLEVHLQRPKLLARILMEQVTLWTLIILIINALTFTSVALQPFSHQPVPKPAFLIRIILNASAARFLVIAMRIALVREKNNFLVRRSGVAAQCQSTCGRAGGNEGAVRSWTRWKTTSSRGQSDYAKVDLFYAVFCAASNVICLGYKENLLLGVTGSFMEIGSTPLECCRLIKLAKRHYGSVSYRKTTILTCALTLIGRAMFPLLFLTLALQQESPLVMQGLPRTWFFLSAFFHSLIHFLLIYQAVLRVKNVPDYGCQSSPRGISSGETLLPFSIHDDFPFNNTIHPNARSANAKLTLETDDDDSDEHHTQMFLQLKDLNYGFLRSYDNRNLCNSVTEEEEGKMNVFKRKEASKNSLMGKHAPVSCRGRTVARQENIGGSASFLWNETGVDRASNLADHKDSKDASSPCGDNHNILITEEQTSTSIQGTDQEDVSLYDNDDTSGQQHRGGTGERDEGEKEIEEEEEEEEVVVKESSPPVGLHA